MTQVPPAVRSVLAATDRVARAMAYVAGAAFLVLALYMTLDVVGRKFFHVSSAVTDEIGGYGLAFGGMWALAWTLRSGGHVRIDVLLPKLPARLQVMLGYVSLALMAVFAGAVAFYTWFLALDSWAGDARATSVIRTPLVVPQALMALGISALALEALVILACGLAASAAAGQLVAVPVLEGEGGEESSWDS